MKTEKVKVLQVNIGDKLTSKNGKDYWKVGVKLNDGWRNNVLFDEEQVNRLKELETGEEVLLSLFEEEYQGKNYPKFKFPSRTDLLEQRVDTLEKTVRELVSLNNLKVK